MDIRDVYEGFSLGTTNSTGDRCIEGPSEEKSRVGNKQSPNSSISSADHSTMKQLDASGDDKRNRGNNKRKSREEERGKRDLHPRDHDKHLKTEKQRRKKMKNMIHELNALLPKQPSKANLISTVDGAICYIKALQLTLQNLETRKQEKLLHDGTYLSLSPLVFQTWTCSNVSLSLCGLDAHINICSSKNSGLLTAICFVLEKYKFDIISAQISSDQSKTMLMIHARINAPTNQLCAGFPYEEICKQAALEINNVLG